MVAEQWHNQSIADKLKWQIKTFFSIFYFILTNNRLNTSKKVRKERKKQTKKQNKKQKPFFPWVKEHSRNQKQNKKKRCREDIYI